jgi:hypothetical protein
VNSQHCCATPAMTMSARQTGVRTAGGSPHSLGLVRRFLDSGRWIVPGGILVLLPKCPLCFAAYFAIGTGIGISITTAIYVRIGLVTLCVVSLLYLLATSFIVKPVGSYSRTILMSSRRSVR